MPLFLMPLSLFVALSTKLVKSLSEGVRYGERLPEVFPGEESLPFELETLRFVRIDNSFFYSTLSTQKNEMLTFVRFQFKYYTLII